MRNKIWPGHQKLLERRVDLVEINIGGKAVNARVAAARLCPEYKATLGDEVRQDSQIRDPSGVDRLGLIAADALIIIAFEIIVPRRFQCGFRDAGMRAQKRVAEQRPEARVFPARIRHHPVKIVEHPPDEMIHIALACRQAVVDWKRVAGNQMGDDRVAVADGFACPTR